MPRKVQKELTWSFIFKKTQAFLITFRNLAFTKIKLIDQIEIWLTFFLNNAVCSFQDAK